MNRRHINTAALASLFGSSFLNTHAQSGIRAANGYPDKPIKIVVPYPAGGVVDVVIRAVADPLSLELAQRMVVDNKTGADGRIGLDFVAKSAPDGYTLAAASPLLSVGEHLMADMKGVINKFAGICGIAAAPTVFLVHSGVPAKTLQEFVALAQSKPSELNVANPGIGSSHHLAQELFFDKTGIKLTNIAYKGQPPSLIDLGQGAIHFALISQNLALPLIQSGRVRALAVNAGTRTKALPNVPTVAEAGFSDVLVRSWYGVAAPTGTPPATIQFLSDQFQRVLGQPAVRSKLEAMDAEILALTAPQFDAMIQSEYKRWGSLIQARKIQI